MGNSGRSQRFPLVIVVTCAVSGLAVLLLWGPPHPEYSRGFNVCDGGQILKAGVRANVDIDWNTVKLR